MPQVSADASPRPVDAGARFPASMRVLVEHRAALDSAPASRVHDLDGVTRPRTRSRSDSMTSPPFQRALFSPFSVPQSSSVMTRSCVTSTEAARQVARVRGLERRVGQTLAGAVRRDEVLQNVQAFAEVRRDRRLDDLARPAWPSGRACRPAGGSALQLPRAPELGHHVNGLNDLIVPSVRSATFWAWAIMTSSRPRHPSCVQMSTTLL